MTLVPDRNDRPLLPRLWRGVLGRYFRNRFLRGLPGKVLTPLALQPPAPGHKRLRGCQDFWCGLIAQAAKADLPDVREAEEFRRQVVEPDPPEFEIL